MSVEVQSSKSIAPGATCRTWARHKAPRGSPSQHGRGPVLAPKYNDDDDDDDDDDDGDDDADDDADD